MAHSPKLRAPECYPDRSRGPGFFSLLAAALFAMGSADAACTLNWSAPTQNEDGSTLTDLSGFKVYVGAMAGGPYVLLTTLAMSGATSYEMDGFAVGRHYLVVTAYNAEAIESRYSNEAVCRVYATPNPPANLTASRFVYTVTKTKNAFILTQVGEVPAGTACNGTQSVNGRYVVPVSAVTSWTIPVPPKPNVVVADCT